MKQFRIVAVMAFLLAIGAGANAQSASELKYVDAEKLTLIGKGFDNTGRYYSRMPEDLRGSIRDEVWELGQHSAGLAVRFSSNARCLGARWTLYADFHMPHMAGTGIRGIDLYTLCDDGKWKFVGTAQPPYARSKECQNVFVRNMDGTLREYMAYLPLYDGVDKLEFGCDSASFIAAPQNPAMTGSEHPIVFYGTSITQGGCVSRPGMTYAAIIGRRAGIETINYGFSGNARMDHSYAEALARIDASAYVIDCLPNCTPKIVRDSGWNFMSYLASQRPDVPIYMVENVAFPPSIVDTAEIAHLDSEDLLWAALRDSLRKEGYKNIRYIKREGLIGDDNEATVDGAHFTDLGMMRMSDGLMTQMEGLKGYVPGVKEDLQSYQVRNVIIIALIAILAILAWRIRWRGDEKKNGQEEQQK